MLKIRIKSRPKIYDEVKANLEVGNVLVTEDEEALFELSELLSDEHTILAKKDGEIQHVSLVEVEFIETEGHYLRLSTEFGYFLIRKTLSEVMSDLPPCFARISNSCAVNREKIKNADAMVGMRFKILFYSGKVQYVARSYHADFKALMGVL